jgi:iron complex transport system ATP-binding protein
VRLEASDLGVRFGDAAVLDGVSLRLAEGRVLGIVGPNGAGKSTLLRCLYGALRPAAGTVTLDGTCVAAAGPLWVAQRVGVVPQAVAPRFPHVVADFVAMGRYPHETARGRRDPEDDVAVRRAMAATGVGTFAERTVDRLSGGEFRRVLFAQVLAQEPSVLLLDEPLQQLDLGNQLQTMELVRRFVEEPGHSAAAVLHDLGMAARCCDDLLLLDRGRVLASGTPEEVLTPSNLARAYGVEAVVRTSDVTGAVEVIPVRADGAPRDAAFRALRVVESRQVESGTLAHGLGEAGRRASLG